MKTLAIALAMACGIAHADEFVVTKKVRRKDALTTNQLSTFAGYKDGKYQWRRPDEVVDIPPPRYAIDRGSFGAFNLGQLGGPASHGEWNSEWFDEVRFDGKDDWLTVVMKNGDVIRGKAQSLNRTTLRLEGRDKPIRMSAVREIVATDPPADDAPAEGDQ